VKNITTFWEWIISFVIPFFLVMTAIRMLFSPVFLQWEYQRSSFPPDVYGFSIQDRLKWANISIEYMNNSAGIDFLGNQKVSDGTPLYNERELSHMLDVKILFQKMVNAWYILLAVLILYMLIAWRKGSLGRFWSTISRGGWITIGIIVAILISVFTNFDALFTGFHRIFFQGDTWLFNYSDHLIRLFPLPFWQDAFILLGVITMAAGIIFGLGGRKLSQT
jgi:integral membrane protein (TIGR01906 family)